MVNFNGFPDIPSRLRSITASANIPTSYLPANHFDFMPAAV